MQKCQCNRGRCYERIEVLKVMTDNILVNGPMLWVAGLSCSRISEPCSLESTAFSY